MSRERPAFRTNYVRCEEFIISTEDSNEINQDLMQRFGRGDEEAFQILFNAYAGRVINFAFRFLRSQAEAEDLAQDVFLRVYKSRERYDARLPFKPWLFAIASRLISNRLRDAKRHPHMTMESNSQDDEPHKDRAFTDPALTPEESAIRKADAVAVQLALDKLPENQRMAVLLARFEEMSYEDIAQSMDTSVASVKSLLFRARLALKTTLTAYVDQKAAQ